MIAHAVSRRGIPVQIIHSLLPKINAEIAKEWGLVDEICNKENIENSAKKWIEDSCYHKD